MTVIYAAPPRVPALNACVCPVGVIMYALSSRRRTYSTSLASVRLILFCCPVPLAHSVWEVRVSVTTFCDVIMGL